MRSSTLASPVASGRALCIVLRHQRACRGEHGGAAHCSAFACHCRCRGGWGLAGDQLACRVHCLGRGHYPLACENYVEHRSQGPARLSSCCATRSSWTTHSWALCIGVGGGSTRTRSRCRTPAGRTGLPYSRQQGPALAAITSRWPPTGMRRPNVLPPRCCANPMWTSAT